ncbi:uncharacterized protein LOC131661399 isoform X2 [Vicia villosa]|uniref:uncharacterized protein LOC131661399 isoform X2 n=1 Tax=Vicia villosa TaxID=3911 RepID=UPI00273BFF94|nr:uncharacterized protein LOC131661399 isoform X2 [Vicia villosa]
MEDLPECPVCLQNYDGDSAIPRVLSCGHTVCEACLVELPERFPNTIRCPACTQLVKYSPKQGPSSLPKNIDLLRICLQQDSSSKHQKSNHQRSLIDYGYSSRFWSDEFYAAWKDWILPNDVVSVEENGFGRFSSGSKGRVCFGVNRNVSLVPIVSLVLVSDSKFKFSYVAWVIKCLEGMNDVAREGLGLILEGSVRQGRFCRVYGLWSEVVGGSLYLVCERQNGRVLDEFGGLRSVSGDGLELDEGGVCRFATIAKGIVEGVIALNLEGLVAGCLGVSCFSFDELGGVCVDLNEVLVMGRKIVDQVSGGVGDDCQAMCRDFLNNELFVSPEVLFTLLHEGIINPESGDSRYPIGYGSDVWSLACVLLQILFRNALPQFTLQKSEENGFDVSASYISWVERVCSVLEEKIGSENLLSLKQTLCKCLDINPGNRPDVVDVRKCIQDVLVKRQFGFLGETEVTVNRNNTGHPVILAKLCQLLQESSKGPRDHELQVKVNGGGQPEFLQGAENISDEDFATSLSQGMTELIDLQGHLGSITGLAVGGGYLFSSSFDKTVRVWSLQDFSHLHTFRGHENKVMALVYVDDDEESLCISGDGGGGIFLWEIAASLRQEPLRKWYEQKDWRFSGIHSLTAFGSLLYTGSGDRTIKAWSIKDGTLMCTMDGHKSVVSTLSVCDDVLYSGSWDGTIRLWSLNDHSPLAVLGDNLPGEMKSILAITVNRNFLVAAYDNGCIKVWRNDVFMTSKTLHSGAIFAMSMQGKCLYTGGWDTNVNIQGFYINWEEIVT